jgi:ethanolamine utilization protein EutQ (cupin superfamily)
MVHRVVDEFGADHDLHDELHWGDHLQATTLDVMYIDRGQSVNYFSVKAKTVSYLYKNYWLR